MLIADVYQLDHIIYTKYKGNRDEVERMEKDDDRWIVVLKNDLESLSLEFGYDEIHRETNKIIQQNQFDLQINWDKIRKAIEIRSDWPAAFRSTRDATNLSGMVDYGFCKKDLFEFCDLHEKNRFRKKIENLLEDCNFHTLCGHLSKKKYGKARRLIIGY